MRFGRAELSTATRESSFARSAYLCVLGVSALNALAPFGYCLMVERRRVDKQGEA